MKQCLLAALLTMTVGLIPGMGIPGALVFEACFPIIRIVVGQDAQRRYTALGPGAWGVAILLTLFWPPMLVLLWWVSGFAKSLPHWGRVSLVAVGMYVWGLILTILCYNQFPK